MLKRDVNFSESNKLCQLSAQYLLISEVTEEIKTVEQRRFSGLCETPSTREGTWTKAKIETVWARRQIIDSIDHWSSWPGKGDPEDEALREIYFLVTYILFIIYISGGPARPHTW